LPNAECLTFEACGHFPELEAPQRFAQVLGSLLDLK
jgi:pimeloyl-ACP methyl ester carboxylesterase